MLCWPTGRERRERELQEALRKAEEEQRLHQQQEEVAQMVYTSVRNVQLEPSIVL